MARRLSSGLFSIHFPGNGTTLYGLVSSFQDRRAIVGYAVNVWSGNGEKTSLTTGELRVSGGQTGQFAVDNVNGQTVEVIFDLPTSALAPSVALVGTFAADGAESTLVWVSPHRFTPQEIRGEDANTEPVQVASQSPATGSSPKGAAAADAQEPSSTPDTASGSAPSPHTPVAGPAPSSPATSASGTTPAGNTSQPPPSHSVRSATQSVSRRRGIPPSQPSRRSRSAEAGHSAKTSQEPRAAARSRIRPARPSRPSGQAPKASKQRRTSRRPGEGGFING